MAITMQPILPAVRVPQYVDFDWDVDGAGNVHLALGGQQGTNANITWIDYYKINPAGQVVAQDRALCPAPYKLDDIAIGHSGNDVVVGGGAHEAISDPDRRSVPVGGKFVGVWETRPGLETEEGGPNAFAGGEGEPNPMPGITPEEIAAAVRVALGVEPNRSLAQEWGAADRPGKWRQVLEDKSQDAIAELFDEANTIPVARTFRDRYFQYVKNAAANPLANVLGGLDDWGEARQDELIAIIQEANGTPPPAPKKAKP